MSYRPLPFCPDEKPCPPRPCYPCYPCPEDCPPIDNSLAIAGFEENKSNPVKGKNVLIIGASKGIGKGAAEQFLAAGANVIGTSRLPSDYPLLTYLDPVPLDLTDNATVVNFFTNSAVKDWDHIDILILGGVQYPSGFLSQCNASDLYTFMNVEIFGRLGRVVSQCMLKMKDVDDSRIIVLSSIASIVPTVAVSSYSLVKAALVGWVKQFNMEKHIFNQYQHGNQFIKTTAIAFEATGVITDAGSYPSNLCPAPIFGPLIYQWQSGAFGDVTIPAVIGSLTILNNAIAQGMSYTDAGKSLLYMATVNDPEWQYVVLKPGGEIWAGKPAEWWLKRILTHKCKKPILDLVDKLNYPVAYYNGLYEGNSKQYSLSNNPPKGATAPYIEAPAFRPDWPNSTTQDPTPGIVQLNQKKNVCDLITTQFHSEVPCPDDSPCKC